MCCVDPQGIVVVLVVVVLMAVLIPPKPVISTCPASYQSHPLILVSLDGFRADYLERGLTPGLQALVDEGVHAPYMKPSYPTLTFPNHYSIVTVSKTLYSSYNSDFHQALSVD